VVKLICLVLRWHLDTVVMFCSLMLRWQLVAAVDVMLIDVEMTFGCWWWYYLA
jgi:hypothetical protein